ncbi:primase/helicase [Vibrio phage VP4]|uniref:Primase/helicase n=1 Tax=Vibrio phage VP4 TaxID=329886 RepID=Q4TVX9_9CAUD|nr:primase/helicase [Vibrio phage VP4]
MKTERSLSSFITYLVRTVGLLMQTLCSLMDTLSAMFVRSMFLQVE